MSPNAQPARSEPPGVWGTTEDFTRLLPIRRTRIPTKWTRILLRTTQMLGARTHHSRWRTMSSSTQPPLPRCNFTLLTAEQLRHFRHCHHHHRHRHGLGSQNRLYNRRAPPRSSHSIFPLSFQAEPQAASFRDAQSCHHTLRPLSRVRYWQSERFLSPCSRTGSSSSCAVWRLCPSVSFPTRRFHPSGAHDDLVFRRKYN